MLGFIASLFTGGSVSAIENIASEFIETDLESAEAKALMIKTLDPNGKMRRDLSSFSCKAYGFYLVSTTILIFMHSFGLGDVVASKEAMEGMTALFTPITASWASIVAASFGVNGVNAHKGN